MKGIFDSTMRGIPGHPKAMARRIVALAVGATLLAAACGSPTTSTAPSGPGSSPGSSVAPGSPGSSAATGEPVTITLAVTTASPEEDAAWKAMIAAFEAANPDIKVEANIIPDQNFSKLRILVQTGTAADVTQVSDDDTYTLGAGFASINDQIGTTITEDAVSKVAWETFEVADTVKFVNPVLRPLLAVYNRDMLAEAGITAPSSYADAWEWGEFVDALKKLTKDTNGDGEPEQWGMSHAFSLSLILSYSNGGSGPYNADQTKCRMTEPDVQEIYDALVDLRYGQKLIAPEVESGDMRDLFNTGRAAIIQGAGNEIAVIDPSINWDVMPLPKLKANAVAENFGRPIGISNTSQHLPEAKRFVAFLLGEEAQKITFDGGLGLPVNKAAIEYATGKLKEKIQNANVYFEARDADVDMQNVNPLGEEFTERFIRVGGREVLSGQKAPAAMLAEQCAAMDEFIADSGWVKP